MFEYVGSEESMKGYVSLHEILRLDSHGNLIMRLAEIASGVASKGKYSQVYGRAIALCAGSWDMEISHLSS
jgi:hypothetical protein